MAIITMKQLLESGVHFGHQTRRWDPKMAKYIYTSRNGIHIIDLQQTVTFIEDAYNRMLEIAKNGGKVLFVGTKKQAQDSIIEQAKRSEQFYVSKRWLGGTLTNFKTIRKSIRRLHQIKTMEKDGTFERLPKKEVIMLRKELARLETFLGGIQDMRTLPEALFVVDPRKEINAVLEARKLKIPVFGMVDTNCDPDLIDHIIPANDDAIRSIRIIVTTMANAMIEGAGGVSEGADEEEKSEAPKPEAKPRRTEQKPAPKPEAKPAPKPAAKPDVKPEPKAEPKPKAKPEPKAEAKPKAKPAPKPEAKPEAKPEPKKAPEAPKKDAAELEKLTVPELREMAKEKGLTGYSKLKKAELIDALLK